MQYFRLLKCNISWQVLFSAHAVHASLTNAKSLREVAMRSAKLRCVARSCDAWREVASRSCEVTSRSYGDVTYRATHRSFAKRLRNFATSRSDFEVRATHRNFALLIATSRRIATSRFATSQLRVTYIISDATVVLLGHHSCPPSDPCPD